MYIVLALSALAVAAAGTASAEPDDDVVVDVGHGLRLIYGGLL
jgi:hypothetical protein